MKTIFQYLLLTAACAALGACQDFSDDTAFTPETPELSFVETSITAEKATKDYELSIKSNLPWRIECDKDWVSFDPSYGQGDATITVTVAANRTLDERTATISAYVIKGENVTLPVTQAAASASDLATHYYVKTDGSADKDGLTWETATTLANAIDQAMNGDVIHVAAGSYVPSVPLTGMKTALDNTFEIHSNFSMIGGYPADAAEGAVADPVANETILDGDHAVCHVVAVTAAKMNGMKVSLDGFTIKNGSSQFSTVGSTTIGGVKFYQSYGAGIFIGNATVDILNCKIVDNTDIRMGAIRVDAGAEALFDNCVVADNATKSTTTYNCGGLWADGAKLLRINNCTFSNNKASGVAPCIYVFGDTGGKTNVLISNTTISGNSVNPEHATLNGGIEKASANLIGFAKTSELAPGASENVTVTFKAEDMASYDTYGKGCYVLEKGDYVISINADSHTVLDSKVYNVASDIVYDASNKRESDVEVADNKFDFAEGNVTYLSRADGFANYAEATAAPADFELPAEAKATFYNNSNWNPEDFNNADDVAPTTGAKNGLKLKDMVGVDYNDAQWDTFLDQLTVSDMDSLIALGGYQSVAVDSIGKVQAVDCDGPASINNNFTKQGSIGFPSAVMIAATWNTDLAHDFGTSIGKMADDMDVSGWYAPAMNIHRSAFAGRNFEYYSEDGVLSGAMAANAIMGSQEQGVYAFMKHFALNDQETNRCGMLCTWSNEQAIREIYLKPFEQCIKAADCHAVMSSFNYIGNTYAGNCSALLNDVLRGEWGFVGMVLTDYYGVYGYQDSDRLIRNGGDFCLVNYDTETNHLTDTTSATALVSARQACKNILYTVANSRAYYPENLNPGMPGWEKVMIGVDVVLAAALIALEVLVVKKGYAKRKEEEVNA